MLKEAHTSASARRPLAAAAGAPARAPFARSTLVCVQRGARGSGRPHPFSRLEQVLYTRSRNAKRRERNPEISPRRAAARRCGEHLLRARGASLARPVLQVMSEEPGSLGSSPWFNCSAAALPKGRASGCVIQRDVRLLLEETHSAFEASERLRR